MPSIERLLLEAILGRISVGSVMVTYWDGSTVTYGDAEPSVHVTFKNASAARGVLRNISLGFGEGYMDGDIEVSGPLDHLGRVVNENAHVFDRFACSRLFSAATRNTRSRQRSQVEHHYDLGNEFFKLWLDRSMTYSCAYFRDPADTLEVAQDQKRRHLLRKLQLERGMTLLDIGSGWGGLLFTAAQEHGITGMGVTLSAEQHRHCTKEAERLGLADKVRFALVNYQDLAETRTWQFDRVVSVGMFEHVGRGNQDRYFGAIAKLLKPGGVSVLHTIFANRRRGGDAWIKRHIFPGGHLPVLAELTCSMAEHDQHLLDVETLRLHYAMTLDEWWRRFEEHKATVVARYGERFYRMWRLYLAMSSSGFRHGNLDLAQIVFTNGLRNAPPLTREYQYRHLTPPAKSRQQRLDPLPRRREEVAERVVAHGDGPPAHHLQV